MEPAGIVCSDCGGQNPAAAAYCQTCGNLLRKTIHVAGTGGYAGFWKRFAALVIDAIILSTATGLLIALSFGAAGIAVVFGPWVYEAAMLSSEWQATVGKKVMQIAVTGLDGGRISFARATGRHFAKYISAFLLMAGYLMAAFTERKQALHDMIAGTLVVVQS